MLDIFNNATFNGAIFIVTAGMDISAGSDPTALNLTGRMDPGMTQAFRPSKANHVCIFKLGTFNFFTVL